MQSAPLWLMKPTVPGRAMAAAKVAFSPVSGLITPRQFGPMTRILAAPRLFQELLLELGALRPDLLEAGGDDDRAADAGLAALVDDAGQRRRRA